MHSRLHEELDEIFKDGGLLGSHFPSYSRREPQWQLVETIADALEISRINALNGEKPHHAIAEAGTGTGKSFALTIPLAVTIAKQNAARKEGERQHKGLIVTHTTTLQAQLFRDDLPLVKKVLKDMGLDAKIALYKGKNNYLCTQRFIKFLNSALDEKEKIEMNKFLPEVVDENNNLRLEMCDKEVLPNKPSDEFWEKINIGLDSSCIDCPYKEKGCYYHMLRSDSKDADIYVGNHAMLMQDLKARLRTGKGTLPEYDYVVIDEAHHIEEGLAEDFSSKIEMTSLWGIGKTIKWLLEQPIVKEAQKIVIKDSYTAYRNEVLKVFDFFKKQCNGQSIPWSHQVMPKGIKLNDLAVNLNEKIARVAMNMVKPSDRSRTTSVINRVNALKSDLNVFMYRSKDTENYFFNIKYDRNNDTVSLLITPLNGGELMNKVLFSRIPVIVASATIKVGPNLNIFAKKLGNLNPDDFEQLCVESPFDYKRNSMFYIPADALGAKETGYDEYCMTEMKRLVDLSKGRAFLLFTSKATLDYYYKCLAPYFKAKGYACFKQGDADRKLLVEKFKNSGNGVLFGGDSFWEGVDVPGEALSNVIMQKLPFNTPDPISQAKEALVAAAGRDAFLECQVSPAIVKFKQGVGRLIRKSYDHGIISLLDGRVFIKKSFGKYFINALPKEMGRTVEFDDLLPFVEHRATSE